MKTQRLNSHFTMRNQQDQKGDLLHQLRKLLWWVVAILDIALILYLLALANYWVKV